MAVLNKELSNINSRGKIVSLVMVTLTIRTLFHKSIKGNLVIGVIYRIYIDV